MSRPEVAVRIAIGDLLRRMRREERLSLDEVERLTRAVGVRVTRSHLSRVETGQADLALPRFLALMRALGRPRGGAAEAVDALLAAVGIVPAPGGEPDPAPEAAADGEPDPAAVAGALRVEAARGLIGRRGASLARRLAAAEAALGRWRAAERALERALDLAPDSSAPVLFLQLAVAAAARGRPLYSAVIAEGAARMLPVTARLVRAQAEIAAGRPLAAVESLYGARLPEEAHLLADTLAAEGYLAAGHPRTAWRIASRDPAAEADPAARAEFLLARARCARGIRRPTAGLRALSKARRLAREARLPELVARIEMEAGRCHRAAGDPGRARASSRTGTAILRRLSADRPLPGGGAWQSLLRAAEREAGTPPLAAQRGRPSRSGSRASSSTVMSPGTR
ncbi:MAG: hypothetical protein D6718_02500 [Acidobacteria bacterium]|nr:MAG: hypothetical protein D6718_02500 [Acidobacteriota bacterium]